MCNTHGAAATNFIALGPIRINGLFVWLAYYIAHRAREHT